MYLTDTRRLAAATLVTAAAAIAASAPAAAAARFDDGGRLMTHARITVRQAITAAKSAVPGVVSEIDLEHFHRVLVYNVDIRHMEVKVNALTGSVVAVTQSQDQRREKDHQTVRHERAVGRERCRRGVPARHPARLHRPRRHPEPTGCRGR
jgi:hypothetical protein